MIRLLTFLLGASLIFTVNPAKAEALTDAQKTEMNALIKEYILANPEVILESVEQHQIRQQEEELRKQEENVSKNLPALYENDKTPVVGNLDGDIRIVEFFDYNCGYCKRAFTELQTLMDKDKNVKVLFKEVPILGPSSLEVSKWSLASTKQDKYFEYHAALMNHKGGKNEATLKKIAKDVGLDVDQLAKDKDGKDIKEMIDSNHELSSTLGIRGTPAFVINGRLVRGYVTYDQLTEMIKAIRAEDAQKKDG